jgi:hypothetical protein
MTVPYLIYRAYLLLMKAEETGKNKIYSLIPLEDFKAVLGIDDREDKLTRFCLITATHTIEEYCKRRLIKKKHFEWNNYDGDLLVPLREYPVSKVLAVYLVGNGELLEPDFYNVIPDCGSDYDLPFRLSLSRAIQRYGNISNIKVVYWAGYSNGLVPADLSAACLELASWNMNRYKGRRIGMTGNVRGGGKDGEHFEPSMPLNVKQLLEPHRRKTI